MQRRKFLQMLCLSPFSAMAIAVIPLDVEWDPHTFTRSCPRCCESIISCWFCGGRGRVTDRQIKEEIGWLAPERR